MPKMLKTHQNTIGNFMIALLFVGGCIFFLTGSWDTSESEAAKGCCGGGDATLVAATTGGCCGSTDQVSNSYSSSLSNSYSCTCLDNDDQTDASCDCDAEDNCDNSTGSYSCGGGCKVVAVVQELKILVIRKAGLFSFRFRFRF